MSLEYAEGIHDSTYPANRAVAWSKLNAHILSADPRRWPGFVSGFHARSASVSYALPWTGDNSGHHQAWSSMTHTFSSFTRLSPRLLLVMSRRGRVSRRVSSSTLSNSAHHTWMMCANRCRRIVSIRLSSSATQWSRLAYPSKFSRSICTTLVRQQREIERL